MKLSEIAQQLGLSLHGDDCDISNVADVSSAQAGQLAFVYDPKYLDKISDSAASAFILKPEWKDRCDRPVLESSNPRLDFARVALMLNPPEVPEQGIHETAIIAAGVSIPNNASIGPNVVIEQDVELGEGVVIGAGCFLGSRVSIGKGTRLHPRVTIAHDCTLGEHCEINAGVVIGTDGFGYVMHEGAYIKVPQIGSVVIGNHVEIGANTTVDRGALNNTEIHDGVKLDNMIQVAHNVIIGSNTIISAFTGIAGSTRIGKNCIIGGGVGIRDNIEVVDNVIITGRTFVSSSIREAGSYSSSVLVDTTSNWKKNVMRFRQLDDLAKRFKILEKRLLQIYESD